MRTNHCEHKKTTEIFFIHVIKPRKTRYLSVWNLKPTRISCNAAYQDGISSRPVLPGSRVYLKYRCWDGLGRVMIQRSIRLKGSACSQDPLRRRWSVNHWSRGSLGFTCWRTLPDADLMSFCRELEGMQTPEQAASPSTTSLGRLQEHEAERLQPVRLHSWMSWFATGCCRWFTSPPSWEHSPWVSVLRFSHFTLNAKRILRNSQNC